ncbi:TIGR02677 family protein [Paradesulfitobacterium ferrireducens]|uniref:TIGR02677 family protein n=1 Tax=Paradesulfitobacterium ferrireducens TaxID=2816476 RepID=UPI001A8D3786|nr:TIGR02677 family protein [Paradesulfitobacterium ferrireducens]
MKPVSEATYLTVGNAWRYRTILRYFYQQHERLRHYLVLEEIFEYLRQNPHFQEYSEDMLEQDLNMLVNWKNLVPRQDTGRVSSIEDFKKRKFRYQLTPYTIEIERMVIGLENLGEGFGGSLEHTLFDRLLQGLLRLTELDAGKEYVIFSVPLDKVFEMWQDLYEDFRKLTENATDYLAHLQSEKVEEKMLTEAFLVYKEALTQYLRSFMTSLQRTSFRIEGMLAEIPASFVSGLAERLADHELSIPRLDERPRREQLINAYEEKWQVLSHWFLGTAGRESDLIYLQNATNETIRRLTRFAQRLGEARHHLRSRRNDYLHLANWFVQAESLAEAHELSSSVFGVFHTRHLWAEAPKRTESIETEIWQEPAASLVIRPKIRAYKEKVRPNAVMSKAREKSETRDRYLRQKAEEQELLEDLISQDKIVIKDLPPVDPYIRKTLLTWIAKCMGARDHKGKTETGRIFRLHLASKERVKLVAHDGTLEMPDYVLEFE